MLLLLLLSWLLFYSYFYLFFIFLLGALTRGDGIEGEIVTHNVLGMKDIPHHLSSFPPGEVEIRGEVYITNDDFEELNERQVK